MLTDKQKIELEAERRRQRWPRFRSSKTKVNTTANTTLKAILIVSVLLILCAGIFAMRLVMNIRQADKLATIENVLTDDVSSIEEVEPNLSYQVIQERNLFRERTSDELYTEAYQYFPMYGEGVEFTVPIEFGEVSLEYINEITIDGTPAGENSGWWYHLVDNDGTSLIIIGVYPADFQGSFRRVSGMELTSFMFMPTNPLYLIGVGYPALPTTSVGSDTREKAIQLYSHIDASLREIE